MEPLHNDIKQIMSQLEAAKTRQEKIKILKTLVNTQDEDFTEALLSDDEDADDEHYLNLVLLFMATVERKLDWAKYLIHDCDVDPSSHMQYMLERQCYKGALFLTEAGAAVNNMSQDNKNALLMRAACRGQYKCVEVLLQAGADVNSTDETGKTALIKAVITDQDQCVNLLIDAGADVNITTKKGNTALMFTAYQNLVSLLGAGADPNVTNIKGETVLMCEVDESNLQSVNFLLETGADVNIADNNGYTALIKAVLKGDVKCAQLLMQAEADVNIACALGDTALIVAAWQGSTELVEMLLQEGAHVHKTNMFGQNALTTHVAQCPIFNEEIALMLINAGEVLQVTDPEVKDGDGVPEKGVYVARYEEEENLTYVRVPDSLLNNRLCKTQKMIPFDANQDGYHGYETVKGEKDETEYVIVEGRDVNIVAEVIDVKCSHDVPELNKTTAVEWEVKCSQKEVNSPIAIGKDEPNVDTSNKSELSKSDTITLFEDFDEGVANNQVMQTGATVNSASANSTATKLNCSGVNNPIASINDGHATQTTDKSGFSRSDTLTLFDDFTETDIDTHAILSGADVNTGGAGNAFTKVTITDECMNSNQCTDDETSPQNTAIQTQSDNNVVTGKGSAINTNISFAKAVLPLRLDIKRCVSAPELRKLKRPHFEATANKDAQQGARVNTDGASVNTEGVTVNTPISDASIIAVTNVLDSNTIGPSWMCAKRRCLLM